MLKLKSMTMGVASTFSIFLLCTNICVNQVESTQCERITVPLCKDVNYNFTSFPNSLNHKSQDEAGLEAHQFWSLIEINCSPAFREFICRLYLPACDPEKTYNRTITKPSRSLCLKSKAGCEPLMTQYGFTWPERMNCNRFPDLSPDWTKKKSFPFTLTVRYMTSPITFLSCCRKYSAAAKDLTLINGAWVSTVDLRNQPKVTLTRISDSEMTGGYFTLLVLTSDEGITYADKVYTNWMVMNIPNGHSEEDGVTVIEYEGPMPVNINSDTFQYQPFTGESDAVHFFLFHHEKPLNARKSDYIIKKRFVNLVHLTSTNKLKTAAHTRVFISMDEYANFRATKDRPEDKVCLGVRGYPENCGKKKFPQSLLRRK